MFKIVSLNKKLVIGFLMSGLIPAISISGIVAYKSTETLTEEAKKKLVSLRESKGFQLEELYHTMFGQVSSLAQNFATKDALTLLEESFHHYHKESGLTDSEINSSLNSFYTNEFGKTYNESNIGHTFNSPETITSGLSDTAKAFQYSFISDNKNPLGEKDKLFALSNDSNYGKHHAKYHSTFRTFLENFGYYDIFLVSAKTGDIVYSVFKEVDFATNLDSGPFASSGLGQAYRAAKNATAPGQFFITEMAKYYPSYDAPAQFISAPVYVKDELKGVLVFQVPVQKLNDILTGKRAWREQGQGESGETYIVGADKRMRSISRFLVEDKDNFISQMSKIGIKEDDLNYMKAKETTAISASIDTEGTRKVISGEKNVAIFPDYRNEEVISAYRPLNIEGLNWFILSEMDQSEALESLYLLEKIIFTLTAIVLLVILVVSLGFSKGISSILSKLADELRKGADYVLDASSGIASSSAQLSSATQQQAASLQETSASVSEISAMVRRSSDNAGLTTELAESSRNKAQQGQTSIRNVRDKILKIQDNNHVLMESVDDNNEKIENIITVINEIADKTKVINDIVFQTKLLSFNASVEAARAGEHGKGFSVVAEEVGALAQMSGKAALEISELLEKSTQQVSQTVQASKEKMSHIIEAGRSTVDQGVEEIEVCDNILTEIVSSFDEVNRSVVDIASSANEQAAGVTQITEAIHQLDSVTQQNTGVAHESSNKAEVLKQQSMNLANIVEQIQEIVFGQNVKAQRKHSGSRELPSNVKTMTVYEKKEMTEFDDDRFEDLA